MVPALILGKLDIIAFHCTFLIAFLFFDESVEPNHIAYNITKIALYPHDHHIFIRAMTLSELS
jgi:hypothetical protein